MGPRCDGKASLQDSTQDSILTPLWNLGILESWNLQALEGDMIPLRSGCWHHTNTVCWAKCYRSNVVCKRKAAMHL